LEFVWNLVLGAWNLLLLFPKYKDEQNQPGFQQLPTRLLGSKYNGAF
jgi:hypothetical protein